MWEAESAESRPASVCIAIKDLRIERRAPREAWYTRRRSESDRREGDVGGDDDADEGEREEEEEEEEEANAS